MVSSRIKYSQINKVVSNFVKAKAIVIENIDDFLEGVNRARKDFIEKDKAEETLKKLPAPRIYKSTEAEQKAEDDKLKKELLSNLYDALKERFKKEGIILDYDRTEGAACYEWGKDEIHLSFRTNGFKKEAIQEFLDDNQFKRLSEKWATYLEHELIHKEQANRRKIKPETSYSEWRKENKLSIEEINDFADKYEKTKEFQEKLKNLGTKKTLQKLNKIVKSIYYKKALTIKDIPFYDEFKNTSLDSLLKEAESHNPYLVAEFFNRIIENFEKNSPSSKKEKTKDYVNEEEGKTLKEIEYLKDPIEIMAYANSFITSSYKKGLTKDEILKILKNGKDQSPQQFYARYWKLRDKMPEAFKRFKKHAVQYLNDLEERYKKKAAHRVIKAFQSF